MTEPTFSFRGTSRYIVERQLGDGGFGIVYKVYDRVREEHVALKAIRYLRPDTIYQFKREFRALADVSHPNLVALYELVAEENQYFFTMQLVEGVDFLGYVGSRSESSAQASGPIGRGILAFARTTTSNPEVGALPIARYDEVRLRSALRQLAAGVAALHRAGKLHRDIKPTNVMVTREGHLYLLDFGLVKESRPVDGLSLSGPIVVGTAAYMAPEQAINSQVSEASDWYSVGVMLYEAITGRLPFEGTLIEMLMRKQSVEPPPLPDGTPRDLDRLCMALLARDVEKRPSGERIREMLGVGPEQTTLSSGEHEVVEGGWLVGRESELAVLQNALEASRRGKPVVVHLRGASGLGKTALLETFVQKVAEAPEHAVLFGRCHERETVPFKALDTVIDSLSRYLRRITADRVALLLPREVWALARLFPVLGRVSVIADAPRPRSEIPDRQELRRRGFTALRELLARIADRSPLLLVLDDLQWGDLDSAALLSELLREPDPPPMLLVLSYQAEQAERSPFLQALLADKRLTEGSITLELHGLRDDAARALARSLLGPGASEGLAAAVARESGGNPFFVHALASAPSPGATTLTLEQVLAAWIDGLPEGARRLLEVVALAGHPIDAAIAERAACLGDEGRNALALLRSARLLQRYGVEQEAVVVFHNRIRSMVVGRLQPAELRKHHAELAAAIELHGGRDPERLATHLEGAGELEKASRCAVEAARRALGALAFERAAGLFRRGLRLGTHTPEQRRDLLCALGDALANAGSAGEAAETYLEAAEGANPDQALELRCVATAQLLVSGRIDQGIELLRKVLAEVGLKLPGGPRRALLGLLLRRLWIRMRRLRFRERPVAQISTRDLRRIDITWAVGLSLATSFPLLAARFQAQNLLMSLRAGDPTRVARALALEAGQLATYGGRTADRTEHILYLTKDLAERVGDPYLGSLTALAIASASWLNGEWRLCFESCDQALRLFSENCSGVACELDTAHIFNMGALSYLGEWREIGRRLPEVQQIVKERSDLYLETWMRVRWLPIQLLAWDEPDEAMTSVEKGLAQCPTRGFCLPHWCGHYASTMISVYRHDGQAAWSRMEEIWPAFDRSMIGRIQLYRIQSLYTRAGAALALAVEPGKADRAALLRRAERDAASIESEKMAWANPIAARLQAAVLHLRGQTAGALDKLAQAESQFEARQMRLCAAAVRRQRGCLIGGVGGASLVTAADATFTEQGVQCPERIADALAPGFWTTARG